MSTQEPSINGIHLTQNTTVLPAPSRKRRRLNYNKCAQCRTDKKKCEPSERQWPQRCNRCVEKDLSCSENATSANRKSSSTRSKSAASTPPAASIQHSSSSPDGIHSLDQLESYEEEMQEDSWREFVVGALIDEHSIRLARRCGIDINTQDELDCTALHYAALRGDNATVRALIAAEADLEVRFMLGETALHSAVEAKQESVVQQLLDAKANPNAADDKGRTPLHEAAERGHCNLLEILAHNKSDLNAQDKRGWTPLLSTIALPPSNYLAVVDELLRLGADFNFEAFDGSTPLIEAAKNADCELISVLLERRPGRYIWVNHEDYRGCTALWYAIKTQQPRWFEAAALLVRANASLNCRNKKEQAPWHILESLGKSDDEAKLRMIAEER